MTDGDEPVKPAARAPAKFERALEWLTLSARIAEAKRSEARSAAELLLLTRATRAGRAADRLLDSPHALEREPELALDLYAQAAYWLGRLARPEAPPETPLGELLAPESDAKAWLLAGDEEINETLAEPFHVRAERSRDEATRRARAAQRWLRPAIERASERFSSVPDLRARRALRLYPALVTLFGGLLLVTTLVARAVRGPDLAAARPWRASSSLYTCNPSARQCGGVTTAIFFHTREEQEPWVEIDLQSVTRISRVEVDNRSDGGAERAVPLIVEVSTDGAKYTKVAERWELFSTWEAKFEPIEARYVRLRSPRQTMLHLERVSVRR
jgi:hypothetical protein